MKLSRPIAAAAALFAISSAHAGFTLNDLVKKTTGVDMLAKMNAAQYPQYANGLELLTTPADGDSGVSTFLRKGVKTKYPDNEDALAAGSNAFKTQAGNLVILSAGGKLSDAQLKHSAAAEECAAEVMALAQHVSVSEGFEWQSDVWNLAFPPEQLAQNENLRTANGDYSRLQGAFGQQFESRKSKVGKLPAGMRQVCALAGVTLSTTGSLSREDQVEKDGAPSQLGVEHAMHRLLDGGNSAVQTTVLSVEKHGCTKDGTGYRCDISSHVKNLFYAPTLAGAKPLPPSERRDNIVDTYRLVWSNQSKEWLPITK